MIKVIFITGATNSGKTSLKNYLLENSKNIHNLPLHTTRPKREGEVDGVDYFFDTEKDLIDYICSDKIFEMEYYKTPHGQWYYYTLKRDLIKNKINIVCASVDTLARYYQEAVNLNMDIKIIPIYLNTDKQTMETRYLERNKDKNDPEIKRRIEDDYNKYHNEYGKFLRSIVPEDNIFLNTDYVDKDKLFKNILKRIRELI